MYTRETVAHYVREDRYVLIVEKRSLFWDKINHWCHIPFEKSDYGVNIWGSIWEWSMHKGDGAARELSRTTISKEEAESRGFHGVPPGMMF